MFNAVRVTAVRNSEFEEATTHGRYYHWLFVCIERLKTKAKYWLNGVHYKVSKTYFAENLTAQGTHNNFQFVAAEQFDFICEFANVAYANACVVMKASPNLIAWFPVRTIAFYCDRGISNKHCNLEVQCRYFKLQRCCRSAHNLAVLFLKVNERSLTNWIWTV